MSLPPTAGILIASMDPETSRFRLSHRPSPGGLCGTVVPVMYVVYVVYVVYSISIGYIFRVNKM